jgi:hypothetical protein
MNLFVHSGSALGLKIRQDVIPIGEHVRYVGLHGVHAISGRGVYMLVPEELCERINGRLK